MFSKRIWIISLLLISLLAVSAVSATEIDDTQTITSPNSDGDIISGDIDSSDDDWDDDSDYDDGYEDDDDYWDDDDGYEDDDYGDDDDDWDDEYEDDDDDWDDEENPINAKIEITKSGTYYQSTSLKVKVTDADTDEGLEDVEVYLDFSNGKTEYVTTDSDGEATCKIGFDAGTYSVEAGISDGGEYEIDNEPTKTLTFKIEQIPLKFSIKKMNTVYKAGDVYKVKVINSKTKKAVSGIKITVKIYTGSKYQTLTGTTDSKGICYYWTDSLSIGTHKVAASVSSKNVKAKSATSSIKVTKSTPAISFYSYNIGSPFPVTLHGKGIIVKDKKTKKPLSGIKVTLKLFTSGKKYKTYTLYTYKDGKCGLFTNKYSYGSHKLVVTASAAKLKTATKTSTLKIRYGEKFTLNGGGYFNIVYSKGSVSITR